MLLSDDEVGRAARTDMMEFFSFGILIRGRVGFIFVTFSYCLGMVRVWNCGIYCNEKSLGFVSIVYPFSPSRAIVNNIFISAVLS